MFHTAYKLLMRCVASALLLALLLQPGKAYADQSEGPQTAATLLDEADRKWPACRSAIAVLRERWQEEGRLTNTVTKDSVNKAIASTRRYLETGGQSNYAELSRILDGADAEIVVRSAVYGDDAKDIVMALEKKQFLNSRGLPFDDDAVRKRISRLNRMFSFRTELDEMLAAASAAGRELYIEKTLRRDAEKVPENVARYFLRHKRLWGKVPIVVAIGIGTYVIFDGSEALANTERRAEATLLELSQIDLRYSEGDLALPKLSYDSSASWSENLEKAYESVRTEKVKKVERPLMDLGVPGWLATPLAIMIILIGWAIYGKKNG